MDVFFSVFAVVNMLTRAHVVFGDQKQVEDHTLGFGEVYGCGLVRGFVAHNGLYMHVRIHVISKGLGEVLLDC